MASKNLDFKNFFDNTGTDIWPMDVYTAASLGDINFFMKYESGQGITKLIEELSGTNSAGWTPLMYACSRGHSLLVNYFLKSGVSRKCKTQSGVTPLMLAVSSGDLGTVESVFDFLSMEEKDYKKWTPLFYSVHFTREKCLNFLLSRGAEVNIVDYQNETPLMVAIKLGRETMVELILKTATNLDVVSFKHESALMLANESSSAKIKSMVTSHYEFLKNRQRQIGKLTPELKSFKPEECNKENVKPQEHFSPSPLKQLFKCQTSQIKLGKSLIYSPNKALKSHSPSSTRSSPWKSMLSKKFWSPQTKPHNNSVEQFLEALNLEKYWPLFRDEEVDFETLLTFNEENLKELGISLDLPIDFMAGPFPYVSAQLTASSIPSFLAPERRFIGPSNNFKPKYEK